ISILKKKRQAVSDYRVEVFGERAEDHPRRFLKFFVRHIVSGNNIQENAVIDAIKLSEEKYCSVAATLRPSAPIETSYSILDEEGNITEGKIH
ncbi:MAG TPA: OsmC family protein, partial [Pyrinomonadaceae bacterium]|nr:OsmC family protein [Pyrinomonadaceae bacterium]